MNARPLSIIPALCDHEDCHSRDISWIEYLGGAFCPVHADPTASYEDDTVKAPRAERRRQIHTSHDACDHPKTKAGRQACRRARARGANITSEETLRDMAEKSRQEAAQRHDCTPELFDTGVTVEEQREYVASRALADQYAKLTQKQQDAIWNRLHEFDCNLEGDMYPRVSLAMVDAARAGKCSIAKLTDKRLTQIIAVAEMLDR